MDEGSRQHVMSLRDAYGAQYIDGLLNGSNYSDLSEISGAIYGRCRSKAASPTFGLPVFAFLFIETLTWFASAWRSGAWTYFEATPESRQSAMVEALRCLGPENFATWYEFGMQNWRDDVRMNSLNNWMEQNDDLAHNWLRQLLKNNREDLLDLN